MFRALRGLLIFFFAIVLVLSGLYLWVRTSLPRYRGTLSLPGVAADVEIARDEYGVPRIAASSLEDAFFSLGFVHAQDRLWQMESERLRVAGRLAEVLGERELASDRLMRTLGLYQAADRDLQALTPRAHGVLQAYSDGINAFLTHSGKTLPPEFLLLGHRPQPWSAVDVVARAKGFAWQEAGDWRDELVSAGLIARSGASAPGRLLPGGPDSQVVTGEQPAVTPELRSRYRQLPLQALLARFGRDGHPSRGSRAWVVAGSGGSDGALMAHELHGRLHAPTPYYLVEISAPGLDVAGATLPGMPVLLSGRNQQIAWAMVNAGLDSQDLYLERLSSGRFRAPGGWHDLQVRNEMIEVRGGDDVEQSVRSSSHGPLVSDLLPDYRNGSADLEAEGETHALALAWTALRDPDRSLQGLLDLLFASDWGSFADALRNVDLGGHVVLYGHANGDIGLQTAARLPLRSSGDGRLPVAGWRERFEWDGFVPFNELPRLLGNETEAANGAQRIVVATSDPASTGAVEGESGPAGATSPSQRVHLLLDDLSHHTPLSFERILAEQHIPLASELLPLLRSAKPLSELAARAQRELVGWDGFSEPGDPAALIFTAWYQELASLIFVDEMSEELAAALAARPDFVLTVLTREPRRCDDRRTEGREDCAETASRALREAAARLAEQLGPDPREWRPGRLIETYRHPFYGGSTLSRLFDVGMSRGRGPGASDAGTPPTSLSAVGSALPVDRSGPIYRAVYDLGEETGTRFLIPTGQSGNPLARGYRNLTEAWSEVRLHRLGAGVPEEGGTRLLLQPRR